MNKGYLQGLIERFGRPNDTSLKQRLAWHEQLEAFWRFWQPKR